jgi:Protein of unknown function (DUF4232)
MVGALLLASSPAYARATVATSAKTHAAACQLERLRITIPETVTGDPTAGMQNVSWNIGFRNLSSSSCSLRGWPDLTILNSAGKTAQVKVVDTKFNNMGRVPDAPITLGPGQTAVATATSASATPPACLTRWSVKLAIPGERAFATERLAAQASLPCLGSQLQLSPFTTVSSLQRSIRALSTTTTPAEFTHLPGKEPATCSAADLSTKVASSTSAAGQAVVVLTLATKGGACTLPGAIPVVRLHESGGLSPMAKALGDAQANAADRSVVHVYGSGSHERTALTLRPGAPVSIALVAAQGLATPASLTGCHLVNSVTVYPSTAGIGAGDTEAVSSPIRMCGTPRTLNFMPGKTGAVLDAARSALEQTLAGSGGLSAGDSVDYHYGADSNGPTACGPSAYKEPLGDCGNGTDGDFGIYVGELGAFGTWKSCSWAGGLNQNSTDYADANSNAGSGDSVGYGAAVYWFAAGAGRDPNYNGTQSEATTWGKDQAERIVDDTDGADGPGQTIDSDYIFMDIEAAYLSNGYDNNGWNTAWNGVCGQSSGDVIASSVAGAVDHATYLGFINYVYQDSPYYVGVYSAGGPGSSSWGYIMGSENISDTSEWTFSNESLGVTSASDFPQDWSDPGASADWFASAPSKCDLMWQWSGGDGVVSGYGDFDQASQNNLDACQ